MAKSRPTFMCGMGHPYWPYRVPDCNGFGVIENTYTEPKCDHCFCKPATKPPGSEETHLRCCKCDDLMAEKYVKAWMDIWEMIGENTK